MNSRRELDFTFSKWLDKIGTSFRKRMLGAEVVGKSGWTGNYGYVKKFTRPSYQSAIGHGENGELCIFTRSRNYF